MGNKFKDPDFLREIGKSDILGISETHIFNEIIDELDIPNFIRLGYKIERSKITLIRLLGV